ncbi:putative lipoprotein signal peptidase [Mycobacterium xenopi 4042]|uniref:Putative lipoprotein signal peptidase n=1 Tax=Mycobacterium xenopi 4042 TaxID=1299334 RepID=X7YPZ6_MYCXE|nr:putative lipoprotein signal peptidase [Mycobacterium xenopi 4042]
MYPVAIENAAPELRTNVQVTVSPMIDTGCPGSAVRQRAPW